MQQKEFDIIIAGAGMAGLSLCYRALKSGIWGDKSIAIIESSFDLNNDKTWCFWENNKGPFDCIVYKQWKQLSFFANNGKQQPLDNGNFSYKMIRSIDFKNLCFSYLRGKSNVHFIEDTITKQYCTNNGAHFSNDECEYRSKIAFNTLYHQPAIEPPEQYFLQHFKGWLIETDQVQFDKTKMHLMDFRPSQKHGCTFMYVLPLSNKKALVEYTLFTKNTLRDGEYNTALNDFIVHHLGINNYRITESEQGIIPMTDHLFERQNGAILNLGSAGGDTRPSTGYTFRNTQKTIDKIIAHYTSAEASTLPKIGFNTKHHLLDSTLLKVFDKGQYAPDLLFTDLFTKTSAQNLFNFLDGNSTLGTDIKVMKSLPAKYFILPFIQSIVQHLKKRRG